MGKTTADLDIGSIGQQEKIRVSFSNGQSLHRLQVLRQKNINRKIAAWGWSKRLQIEHVLYFCVTYSLLKGACQYKSICS